MPTSIMLRVASVDLRHDVPQLHATGVAQRFRGEALELIRIFLGNASDNVAEFTTMVAACQILSDERA
jgi:hypothetical protein